MTAGRRRRRFVVVNVVGPDGVGKTTLTEELVRLGGGRRHVLVVANRDDAVSPNALPHRPRASTAPASEATVQRPYPAAVGWAKALYLFVDHRLGWSLRVLPHARRTGPVVIERGWWDHVVDAPRYRLGSTALVRALGLLLPRPDVVLVLDAPGDVVTARKAQLSPQTVERHRATWRGLRTGAPKVFIDAKAPQEDVTAAACAAVQAAAARAGRVFPLHRARPPASSRSQLLLPLLQRVSEAAPTLLVWKNADRALGGEGDLDVVCSPEDRTAVEAAFRAWAAEHAESPVVVCEHSRNGMYLLARAADGAFAELDVKWRVTVRGAPLFTAASLVPLAETDPRGFRRLRPGAEGLLKLAVNGVERTGAPRRHRIQAEHVVDLMVADPEGARRATTLFGPLGQTVHEAAGALVSGRAWERRSWLRVQLVMALRGARDPRTLAARLLHRDAGTCGGVKQLVNAGVVDAGDPDWWSRLPAPHHRQEVAV